MKRLTLKGFNEISRLLDCVNVCFGALLTDNLISVFYLDVSLSLF